MKKIFIAIFILAIFSSGILYAEELPTAKFLFDKMQSINPNLKDYSSEITVTLKGVALILPINLDLKGKYFYKKPDRHKLELERAPKFLSKYPQIFGWHLPELAKHTAMLKDVSLNEIPCWKITLTPIEGRGDIIQEDIWVNKSDYTFLRHLTTYKKDAFIEVNVQYRREGENILFDKMKADFYFPAVRVKAAANANYKNYKINPGLSDDFFLTPEDIKKREEEAKRKAEEKKK